MTNPAQGLARWGAWRNMGMAWRPVVPSGRVTFLFTDVESSTRLWAADKDAMSASLLVHDSILRSAIEGNGGYVFATRRRFVRGGVRAGVGCGAKGDGITTRAY